MSKRFVLLAFTIVVFCTTTTTRASHILVIESYHDSFQWDIEYKKGLTDLLAEQHSFSYFQMDTKRLPEHKHQQRIALAWQAYLTEKPDIVVLGDDNALKYLGPLLKKTTTPVVYLGINNNPRNYAINDATNITGILERPLLKRSVLLAKEIVKNMKKALVLLDSGTTSNASLQTEFKNQSIMNIGGIKVEVALIERYSLWQQKVLSARASGFDVIFIGLFQTIRDTDGKHVKADEILAWTAKKSPVPLFGFWAYAIGKNKASGGLVLEGYQQGIAAALIVKEILAGKKISEIRPRVAEKGRYIFSRSEVAKHQLRIPETVAHICLWVE